MDFKGSFECGVGSEMLVIMLESLGAFAREIDIGDQLHCRFVFSID